ncbi:hypothetical protein NDU88_000276 [Pleurodeles waltl]|uniref:Uncharacterized protein n=1 Tax=Pleurodeles waltl TaxID=8319 RepID=A0AAV7V4W8_PLEWA|nr:hypothetical protein NDU88_000276 [Pleurodeles waltl]
MRETVLAEVAQRSPTSPETNLESRAMQVRVPWTQAWLCTKDFHRKCTGAGEAAKVTVPSNAAQRGSWVNLVCVPVEVDVVAGVVWPRNSPATTTRLGPGLEEDAWAVGGSTCADLVDVVSVVVGGTVGGACGVAHHAPEARSEWYLRAILRYPHCTCRMCLYLIARCSKWLRSAALMFAAVKRKGKYLALDLQWVEYHNGSFVHY